MSNCSCGDSVFPQSVVDQVLSTQTSNSSTINTTKISVDSGMSISKTTKTDASGNVTQEFAISGQAVGTWRSVTQGASGEARQVNGRPLLRTRIEQYTKPTVNAGANTAGTKAVIRIEGSYGYDTPVINTMEHIATVNAEARPAHRITFPILCHGVDQDNLIVGYASGIAHIDTNGELHAMFTSAVPVAGDNYVVEIDFTYTNEA